MQKKHLQFPEHCTECQKCKRVNDLARHLTELMHWTQAIIR